MDQSTKGPETGQSTADLEPCLVCGEPMPGAGTPCAACGAATDPASLNSHAYLISRGWFPLAWYDGDNDPDTSYVEYRRGTRVVAVALTTDQILANGRYLSREDVA